MQANIVKPHLQLNHVKMSPHPYPSLAMGMKRVKEG